MLLSVGDRIILLFYLFGKGVCFFILLDEEHIEDSEQSYYSENKSHNIQIACEGISELIYHKRNNICKAALICDSEPSPLSVVHLTLYSTDRCEARCAKKIEYEERVAGDSGECLTDSLPNGEAFTGITGYS